MGPKNESSRPRDFHVDVNPALARSLRRQVADSIRDGCRSGRLSAGTALPSTRALARQLGVSRGVITDAYQQLAAEGYVEQRERRAPVVCRTATARAAAPEPAQPYVVERSATPWRHNLSPWAPDTSTFPRTLWAGAVRRALQAMPDRALGYDDPRGPAVFRTAICSYLARTRGCDTDPVTLVACSGFAQGLYLTCLALWQRGATTIAVEDPSHHEFLPTIRASGLEPLPIPVDSEGLRVDLLATTETQAVVVTPAHQFPTGVVMSPSRRQALVDWAQTRAAFILEDDYDAEYRYDRNPVGSLQGRLPHRVVYLGTTAKTLAPAVRVGWLHTPRELLDDILRVLWDCAGEPSPIAFWAFADLLERGEIDRHLRRTRTLYRARRQRLIDELKRTLPGIEVGGIAAGLHLTLALPDDIDGTAVARALAERDVLIETLAQYAIDPANSLPGLVAGYSRLSELHAPIVVGILADAIARQHDRSDAHP